METTGAGSHFDHWAPSYDRSIHQKFFFEPVHAAVIDAFGAVSAPPAEVVDVGCGTGRLLESAARRWGEAQLTGIDVSGPMIAEAQRKHQGNSRFTFKQGDASALPAESASFDAAFSTMSFHHWGTQEDGIREIARVLRPGGVFVLADIDVPLLPLLRPFMNLTDHATFRSRTEIERFLERAGLDVLTSRRFWRFLRIQLFVARKQGADPSTRRA